MAFVDSNTATEDVEAAYEDAAQYDMGGGVTMAKEFVVAARILLRRISKTMKRGDLEVEKRIESIEAELNRATKYVRENDTAATSGRSGGQVRHFDLGGFRE
jgi:hypothetical protein